MFWMFQAEFLNHAVEAILELYTEDGAASSFAPSVMIVGHSYGGIVARYPDRKHIVLSISSCEMLQY